MISLRVIRQQWGPIINRAAEVNTSCDQMFGDVQSYVEQNLDVVCPQL